MVRRRTTPRPAPVGAMKQTCRPWRRKSRACRWASVKRTIPWVEAKAMSQGGQKVGNGWSGDVPGNKVHCLRMRLPNEGSVVSLASNASLDWFMTEATDMTYASRQAAYTFDVDCRACALPVLRETSMAQA